MSIRIAFWMLLAALPALWAGPVAAQQLDGRTMMRAGDKAREAWPETRARLLEGDVPGAVAVMRAAVKREGWQGKLAVGNMTWVMHPAESRALHEEALAESKGAPMARLEVALHHTRANECDAALADWKALRGDPLLPPHIPMLEAYCLLRNGDDAAAASALERAQLQGHRAQRAYGSLINELWGPRPAIAVYADQMALYKQGGAGASLDALVMAAATVDDPVTRFEALQRAVDVAALREGAQSPRAAELACLRPWFVEEAKAAAKVQESDDPLAVFADNGEGKRRDAALKRCGLLVDGGAFPANVGLGRVMLSWMIGDGADASALLARHGPALKARAEARPGELGALETLAALQAAAKDWDGVAASDELGWRTYGAQKFAESRVMGLAVKDMEGGGGMSPTTLARLDEARRQFPTSAHLLWVDVMSARAAGEAKATLLRQWVLAEHTSAMSLDPLHAAPSNPRLMEAWGVWYGARRAP